MSHPTPTPVPTTTAGADRPGRRATRPLLGLALAAVLTGTVLVPAAPVAATPTAPAPAAADPAPNDPAADPALSDPAAAPQVPAGAVPHGPDGSLAVPGDQDVTPDAPADPAAPPVPSQAPMRAAAAAPVPPTPAFSRTIDPYARYEVENTCSQTEKPGAVRLRDLLRRTYGNHWFNILRSCSSANSGHHEGRALDWGRDIHKPAEKAQVDAFLGWLLATDAHGNPHAMARRLGIQYVMWDGKIWGSYAASTGWKWQNNGNCHLSTSNKTTCHRDHVHISLSWAGANATTSYWAGDLACVSGPDCPVSRLAGDDRYATAVEIGRAAFPSGRTVVIANGEQQHLVDGLVAGPLARSLSAPVLLVTSRGVPAVVRQELVRRGATTAVLVGGQGALGPGVVADLRSAGVRTIDQLAGATRYDTAAAVAARMPAYGAVIASGEDHALADALAVSGPAAAAGTPILLTPRYTLVPAARLALAGRSSTVVAGGPGVVYDAVLDDLPDPVRLGGADRWSTAVAIAEHYDSRVGTGTVAVAAGTAANLVDALPGAALGYPTVLTSPGRLPEVTRRYVESKNVRTAVALGGPGAVSDGVLRTVSATLGG